MTTDHEYTYHRGTAGTVYRIHTEQDTDADSPRESTDANLSTLVTWDSRYLSPDRYRQGARELPADDIDAEAIFDRMPDHPARALHLYVTLYRPDILAAVPLARGGYDGTISTDEDGSNPIGVAYVTAFDWAKLMGDSPVDGGPWLLTRTGQPDPDNTEGNRTPSARQAIEQEIEHYNSWVQGEFAGYVVEQAHTWQDANGATMVTWDDYESVWGYESDTYAAEQATDSLPAGAVKLATYELPDAYLED
jgi:hypothetical protein